MVYVDFHKNTKKLNQNLKTKTKKFEFVLSFSKSFSIFILISNNFFFQIVVSQKFLVQSELIFYVMDFYIFLLLYLHKNNYF